MCSKTKINAKNKKKEIKWSIIILKFTVRGDQYKNFNLFSKDTRVPNTM